MHPPDQISEADFLAEYDASAFPSPLVTVDAVLFTYDAGTLKVLLVKRSSHPEQGKWALPGGFVDPAADRNLNDTAMRVLKAKTGVTPPYIEQLATYGDQRRDKRGWSLTVSYTALIAHQACQSFVDSVDDVQWLALDSAQRKALAFDHKQLLADARERLRQKALYSIVPAYALPETFTLPELQTLHEALLGKPLPRKSFRRRIEQADLVMDTGLKRTERGRPAALYRMRERARDFTFLRNLEA
ncbi:MAG: NUDIX domain-containing protein [Pseudomonadota bacterium]